MIGHAPGAPDDTGVLVGDRDQRFVIADSLHELHDPGAQSIMFGWSSAQCTLQRGARSLDEQSAQIGVAAMRDAAEPAFAATGTLPRDDAEGGGKLPAIAVITRVAHAGHGGTGGQRANAGHFGQPLRGGVVFGVPSELTVECINVLLERMDMRMQIVEKTLQVARHELFDGSGDGQPCALECRWRLRHHQTDSANSPRKRLMVAVRSSMKPWRMR